MSKLYGYAGIAVERDPHRAGEKASRAASPAPAAS